MVAERECCRRVQRWWEEDQARSAREHPGGKKIMAGGRSILDGRDHSNCGSIAGGGERRRWRLYPGGRSLAEGKRHGHWVGKGAGSIPREREKHQR